VLRKTLIAIGAIAALASGTVSKAEPPAIRKGTWILDTSRMATQKRLQGRTSKRQLPGESSRINFPKIEPPASKRRRPAK